MKFTKEEISLCKQIVEKHRKEIGYGDWHVLPTDPHLVPMLLESGVAHKLWEFEINKKAIPLWTISDCVEFFEERSYQVEIKRVSDSWFIEIWKIGHKAESIKEWTAKLLESCLKAALAVIEEEK